MHARGSGEAARRAKRGRQPEKNPSRPINHARGHLRVSRFARQTTEKRETARSLGLPSFFFLREFFSRALLSECLEQANWQDISNFFPEKQPKKVVYRTAIFVLLAKHHHQQHHHYHHFCAAIEKTHKTVSSQMQ